MCANIISLYNFFSGMNAEAVARYQKDALTGHRPTWTMGANGSGKAGKGTAEAETRHASDPFSMFQRAQWPRPLAAGSGQTPNPRQRPARYSTPSARRCR